MMSGGEWGPTLTIMNKISSWHPPKLTYLQKSTDLSKQAQIGLKIKQYIVLNGGFNTFILYQKLNYIYGVYLPTFTPKTTEWCR